MDIMDREKWARASYCLDARRWQPARNRGKTWEEHGKNATHPQPGEAEGQDYRCANSAACLAAKRLPQGHDAIHTHVSLFSFCARHRVLPCLRQYHRGEPPQKCIERGQIGRSRSRPPMQAQPQNTRQNSRDSGHSGHSGSQGYALQQPAHVNEL